MESSKHIEDRAAAWLAKRDSSIWGEADERDLAAWLQENTGHRVAFLRLEAGWERSARLKVLGAGMKSATVPAPEELLAAPFFNHWRAPALRQPIKAALRRVGAIAAGVLLIAGGAAYFEFSRQGDSYATPIGGIASIPLHDGSQMTLNTASKVRVTMTREERRIELESGEAFFDVAKDAKRPFIVEALDKRIVAIGTRFSVRREGSDVEVVVTDGKVRLEREDGDKTARLLTTGVVAHATSDTVRLQRKTLREAEDTLSWRGGYLTFDETSLAQAVGEFNRYTRRKIVIGDPKLAALHISGSFRANNSSDFIQLLRNGFNVHAHEDAAVTTLTSN